MVCRTAGFVTTAPLPPRKRKESPRGPRKGRGAERQQMSAAESTLQTIDTGLSTMPAPTHASPAWDCMRATPSSFFFSSPCFLSHTHISWQIGAQLRFVKKHHHQVMANLTAGPYGHGILCPHPQHPREYVDFNPDLRPRSYFVSKNNERPSWNPALKAASEFSLRCFLLELAPLAFRPPVAATVTFVLLNLAAGWPFLAEPEQACASADVDMGAIKEDAQPSKVVETLAFNTAFQCMSRDSVLACPV